MVAAFEPLSASGKRPSGGLDSPLSISTLPSRNGTEGPPASSTATTPASVYKSA